MPAEYIIQDHRDKINVYGATAWNSGNNWYATNSGAQERPSFLSTYNNNYGFEFVVNITGTGTVEFWGNWSANGLRHSVDGGAVTGAGAQGSFGYNTTITGLANGKHLIRVHVDGGGNVYFGRVRVTDGSIVSVARKQIYFVDNISGTNAPTETSVIGKWGNFVVASPVLTTGGRTSGLYEFGFNGTFAEALYLHGTNGGWATWTDGQSGAGTPYADLSAANNARRFGPLTTGLASGNHTLTALDLGTHTSSGRCVCVCLHNGARLSTAATAGDTVLNVDSSRAWAIGDWIQIGSYSLYEVRQVVAVTVTTVTVAAISNNHPQYDPVSNFEDPQATATTYASKDRSSKRVAVWGDSKTHQQTAGVDWPANTYLGNDPRASWVWGVFDPRDYEIHNFASSGSSSNGVSDIAADLSHMRSAARWYVYAWGTNDQNSNVSLATFETNVRAWATAVKAHGGSGAKYRFVDVYSPVTTNNPNGSGNTNASYNGVFTTILNELVGEGYDAARIVIHTGMTLSPTGTHMADNLHPNYAGRNITVTNAAAALADALAANVPILGSGLGSGLLCAC